MSKATEYKKLSEIEHILTRAGMYIGSTSNHTTDCWLVDEGEMVQSNITYNPGLVKLFDEIISNSVDEHKRTGSVTEIKVDVSLLTGEISVEDNGGIPVKKHPEYKTYIPSMIFGELRTGSNFDDDNRIGAGMNGLGSKLTSVFSKRFSIITSDGKKCLTQTFTNNLSEKTVPNISISNHKGTTISYEPDYERLGCEMDIDNFNKIKKRVYDVAGCNPKIKVYFNKKRILINKFDDYVNMYTKTFITDNQKDWVISIGPSTDDTFNHISFINGVDTFNGGSHIDYIVNPIVARIREFIKKKHKIEVKPNNIRQQMTVFINGTVNAPTFTSQTKEFMSLEPKEYGTEFVVNDRFINAILKSDIVQRVLDWAEAEKNRRDMAELRKMNKQTANTNFLKKIVKFDDATSKNRSECSLVLTEGDSASKAILSARDPKKVGVYPLKGKPLNVRDIKVARLTANDEFANIMSIIGLKIGVKSKIADLRFSKLVIATDADNDGHHICGLIINMFQQFWPDLIKEGFLHRLTTPQIVATTVGRKSVKEFFNKADYFSWAETSPKHKYKYFKGLGGFDTKMFTVFLNDPCYLQQLLYNGSEDFNSIDLAFDKTKADERKEWLSL